MNELVWHFPTDLAEAVSLLQEPGAAPHAGGTGLLRSGVSNLAHLIDLHHLPLRYFTVNGAIVNSTTVNGSIVNGPTLEMGAMLTFAACVEQMRPIDPGSILIQSLGCAASTPLRNRITIGGSVVMAPSWSSLTGPLLALDAEVVLWGDGDIVCPFVQFLEDRTIRKGKLVKAVRFPQGEWQASYFRAAVTRFDYAAFTLTTLVKKSARQAIEDARFVVTGNKGRYQRLVEVEQALIGREPGDLEEPSKVAANVQMEFAQKTIGGPEYVRHLFGVELERAVERALRG
jgi:CO/xanthine dehydrogenase FAD-binding subunit